MRRILCIDADADMLEFMHDVLEDERVDCAPIAGAGLALAAHLPHLLRRVLFITGNWDSGLGRRARQAGVALLPKPFTSEEMTEVVGRIAQRAS